MGGGRCWFAVDSSLSRFRSTLLGKLRGIILERSKGFSSWIRFSNSSLRCLLEGWKFLILEGWVLLADKLLSLGIFLPIEDEVGLGIADVKEGRKGEQLGCYVWWHGGEKRQLSVRIYLEFEVAEEAKRMLRRGIRPFEDKMFHLERWGPKIGYLQPGVFRKLGDSCGELVAVDDDITKFEQL
ncbi:hypothetical protein AAG906_016471 [Vitis piasezkii]